MDPLTALRQIAFRLERTRASTYRVQAFRTAADVVARMDPKILKARTRAGALHEITGIGEVTGTAIAEAVRGEVPSYLRRLEAEQSAPLVDLDHAGHTLLGALRGDLHSHSDWSDGGSPIAEMVPSATATTVRRFTMHSRHPCEPRCGARPARRARAWRGVSPGAHVGPGRRPGHEASLAHGRARS